MTAFDNVDAMKTSDITSVVGRYYDKLMLERVTANVVLYPLCEKKPIPQGGGTSIYFNRYTNFPVATGLLTEGEVPTQTYLSGTSVTTTLFQLGAWTGTSDLLEMTSFSNVIKEATENFADNAAVSIDTKIYSRMFSDYDTLNPLDATGTLINSVSSWWNGTNGGFSSVYISSAGNTITSFGTFFTELSGIGAGSILGNHDLSLDKIARMAAKLRQNNAKPFADGYYKLYTAPVATAQIVRTAEWATWNAYTRPEVLDKGQVGVAHGVKIYESTIPTDAAARTSAPWAAGVSAVWNVIFGKGAIGVTEIAGQGSPKVIVKTTNQYDTSNPLNQWSTIGWKITMAAKVLNSKFGYIFPTLYS